MPVDIELAVESLKKFDKELYEMYTRIREVAEYVENNPRTFEKLRLYLLSLRAINDLEKIGIIEVINDYKRRTVYIKRKI